MNLQIALQMEDYMNYTMEHFQQMCLQDKTMQALYRGELAWGDIPEDDAPLELDGWREYLEEKHRSAAAVRLSFADRLGSVVPHRVVPQPVVHRELLGCWRQPLALDSFVKKIHDMNQGKRTLFLSGITEDITEEEIRCAFDPYGPLSYLHRSKRGIVLLRFQLEESAQKAYLEKVDSLVLGRKKRILRFVDQE